MCSGSGQVKKQTLNVKIPAGVDEGDRIRPAGEGEPRRQRRPGRRPVRGHPHPEHSVFQRNSQDLHCEMPISFAPPPWAGNRNPTLDGVARLKIPAEIRQSGQVFRLRGKAKASNPCAAPALATLLFFYHVVLETR